MNKPQLCMVMLFSMMMLTISAWAGALPDYYPKKFSGTGVIDRVGLNDRELVIDDSLMKLSAHTKVHNLNTQFSTLRTLKPGMKVGVQFSSENTVNEIWVLPRNHGHGHGSE